jgi:hypothetical protein
MKFCPGGTVKLADEFIILVSFEMPSGYRKLLELLAYKA